MPNFQKLAIVLTDNAFNTLKSKIHGHFPESTFAHIKVHEVAANGDHLIITDDEDISDLDEPMNRIIEVLDSSAEYLILNFLNSKHEQWPEIEFYGMHWNNPFELGYRVSFSYFPSGSNHLAYA